MPKATKLITLRINQSDIPSTSHGIDLLIKLNAAISDFKMFKDKYFIIDLVRKKTNNYPGFGDIEYLVEYSEEFTYSDYIAILTAICGISDPTDIELKEDSNQVKGVYWVRLSDSDEFRLKLTNSKTMLTGDLNFVYRYN